MALFFEVVEGPEQGMKFRLQPGSRIGRVNGDILLNDAKVSSSHAFIEENEKGQLVLVDDNSSNGIRINGQKLERITLLPGVLVQIGRIYLKVIKSNINIEVQPEVPLEPHWKQVLEKEFVFGKFQFRKVEAPLKPFNPAIKISFVQGIQEGDVWTLGYGARKAGTESLDLRIYELGAPAICFELRPDPNGVMFFTEFPKKVILNDLPQGSALLKDKDVISIGRSRLKVELIP